MRLLGSRHKRGFSLVEVVMAIGIVAAAFIPLVGLLPVGMNAFRQSMDTTIASGIAQKVINEAIQTDFDTLIDNAHLTRRSGDVDPANFTFLGPLVASASNNAAFRYFDDEGNELVPADKAKAIFHVLTRINPQVPLPGDVGNSDLRNLAQVTVQVVNNPGNQTIPITPYVVSDQNQPLRNMVDPAAKFWTYTAVALVPRNR